MPLLTCNLITPDSGSSFKGILPAPGRAAMQRSGKFLPRLWNMRALR
jgi:hypothetical protein